MHVLTSIGQGGAEMQVLMMSLYMRYQMGYEIEFCGLFESDDIMSPRLRNLGFVVHDAERKANFNPLKQLFRIWRIMRRGHYDVVHSHLMKANFLGGIAARLAGVPRIIAHKHNDEIHMKSRFWATLHDIVSQLTDHEVVYLSRHVENYFVKYGIWPHKNRTIAYYGFDPTIYPPFTGNIRQQLNISDTTFLFGTLSRIVFQKGIDVLIQGFYQLLANGADAALVIAGATGKDQEYVDKVNAMVRESVYGHRVFILGYQKYSMPIFDALDCFVLASRWEGFGMVLLEAMMDGCPIIASRVSAIPEVIRDGVDGHMIPPDDVEALSTAMLQAYGRNRQPKQPNTERLQWFTPNRRFPVLCDLYTGKS